EVHRGRCARAAVRVEAAMKLVTRAIETCQQGDRHREQLGQTIRRTEEMLRHVQDTVVTNDSDQCQQFLRAAIKEQKRAMELFHTDRLRLALRLTLRARELGERALRCANQEVGSQDVNTMKLLERTDHFLAEVEDAVDNKGGRTLLDEAKRLQHEARRQALRRKFELAQRLTEQSRVLAAKSLSKLESDLNTRDVAQMIAGTEDLLQKLDENAPNAAPNATSLLKKAHRLLDDAKSSLQKGKPREAFAKVRASSAAALEVARLLGVHGGH
ncbi:MAG: hypothetical protein HKN21_01260, partial [Candidatus Eisenbacteria bacterium]|nr:hypothetical protein [Candidatus Eisenbacteria bacterium]